MHRVTLIKHILSCVLTVITNCAKNNSIYLLAEVYMIIRNTHRAVIEPTYCRYECWDAEPPQSDQ